MNNLEHAKSLIERAKQQADDWETEEAAVTFSIPLVAGLVNEIEKLRSALAGLVGAESDDELRTMVRHIREIHGYSFEDADRMALSAPTASDTHAELAALRDEVRRLREAMSEALEIIDEQAPALTLEELVKRWAAAQYPPPGGATTEWVRGALELHYELMRRAGYERPQPSKQED